MQSSFVVAAYSGLVGATVLAQPSFTVIEGALPGFPDNSVRDVSADGTVAVGNGRDLATVRAWRWTPDAGLEDLGTVPGFSQSAANAVTPSGEIIVGQSLVFSGPAWRWTESSGIESIGLLQGGGWSRAQGISDDGLTIVGSSDSPMGERAFRWTDVNGISSLGVFGNDTLSRAEQASVNGSVIVGWGDGPDGMRALAWSSNGDARDLGGLADGIGSRAVAVSAAGDRAVGTTEFADGRFRSFMWTEDTGVIDLGTLPGNNSLILQDISSDGRMAVGQSFGGPDLLATIWIDGQGLLDLNDLARDLGVDLGDWSLSSAAGVSANAITGIASRPRQGGGFDNQPYVLVIPTPASASLVLGIPLIAGRRRRRQGTGR